MTAHAIVIDESYDAVLLRDLLRREAQKHHTRASKASQRAAVTENMLMYECFSKYAERCEHIRKEEAALVADALRRKEEPDAPEGR